MFDNINGLEAFWLAITLTTLLLTIASLFDALADVKAIAALDGHARELTARGSVRRAALLVVVQLLLLGIVIPGLFSDRPTTLSPIIVDLMAIPVVLLLMTLFDTRDRRALTVITAAELAAERAGRLEQLFALIETNTRISQEASDHADAAYHEANALNAKIAAQGAHIVDLSMERTVAEDRVEATIDRTADQVADIHKVTVDDDDGDAA